MKITVVGTTDVDYTTAWHYAAAFEKLGHEVERGQDASETYIRLPDALWAQVEIGRRWGVPPRRPVRAEHLFTDDGVWAAANPVIDYATEVHYLRSGCHGPEAHDSEPYPPWEPMWDVAFIGSSPGHSEWPHRVELIAHLREWFGDRFIHVGPGGDQVEDDSKLLWGYADRPLRGHWLNRALRSVGVVVGDTVLHDEDAPHHSERTYETFARGGYMIAPYNRLLEGEIGPYPSWHVGDWAGLRWAINNALAYPEEREAERRRMQEFVRTHCTYEHRAVEMLTVLGLS